MTDIERQIYNDLSTAGWNIFTDSSAKLQVALHLAKLGYNKKGEKDNG